MESMSNCLSVPLGKPQKVFKITNTQNCGFLQGKAGSTQIYFQILSRFYLTNHQKTRKQGHKAVPDQASFPHALKQFCYPISYHVTLKKLQELCFDLTVKFVHLTRNFRPLALQDNMTNFCVRSVYHAWHK